MLISREADSFIAVIFGDDHVILQTKILVKKLSLFIKIKILLFGIALFF